MDGLLTSDALFEIPVSGIYVFHASSTANGNGATPLILLRDDLPIMATGRSDDKAIGPYPHGTGHVVVALEQGETIKLVVEAVNRGFLGGIFNKFSSPSDIEFSAYLLYPL